MATPDAWHTHAAEARRRTPRRQHMYDGAGDECAVCRMSMKEILEADTVFCPGKPKETPDAQPQ